MMIPRPDLLIVARGGGSIEDLWAFNEEMVVRAIAGSPIPVISAVGHETDTTLADHAADRRAPTPTAAAEIAVPVLRELANAIDELGLRQRKCALRPVTLGRERLAAQARLMPRPEALAERKAQKLDELSERLRRGFADRAALARERLIERGGKLSAPLLQANFRHARERLGSLERVMRSLNPDSVLQRGFARVTDASGRTLTSAAAAGKQPALTLRFRDGPLEVVPAASAPRPPRAKPAPPSSAQPKLL